MGETIGVNVLKRAQNMEVSPQFDGYSAVRIFVGTNDDGETVIYESGNTNGRTLEIKNPFGTQEMADNILADIQGYQYQPLSADSALLNPAAEMGDGVTVNGVYSGIFVRATTFGRLMASDIAAPTDEEIEHEFAVESPSDRQYTRFVQQTRSMLKITNLAITAEVEARTAADEAMQSTLDIQATQIAARVTKTGGSQSSFGWVLDDSSHTWYAGNRQVMKVNSSGLEVTGKVTATSGKIGNFNIGTALWNNISNFANSGNLSTGVYIGTDGIRLGRNFSVDSGGNVSATNMTLSGTLTIGGATITAAQLRQGAIDGYNWNNQYQGAYGGTAASYALGGGGAGYSAKDTWDRAQNAAQGVSYLRARTLVADTATLLGFGVGNYTAVINGVHIPYFGWGAPY